MATSSHAWKTSFVLNVTNDWDEWIGVIRTKANGAEIWFYIDQAISENDELPVLEKQKLPSPADISAERAPLTVTAGATSSSSKGAAILSTGPSPFTCYHGKHVTSDQE